MGQVFEVGKEYITEETIQIEVEKILDVLRKEKRTYSMNIFVLEKTIDYLKNKVKEDENSKIFQKSV